MAGTLRDDLASLKIERREVRASEPDARGVRRDSGIGILALLIWLIPLGLVGFAGVYGYTQYEQLRSKTEVKIGIVQAMTSGEAEKLLSAKGYLKSRYQAMIGTKIPGRVERMFVEEGKKVKKDDVLAVLEHHELDALLASRKAMVLRTKAELVEARADVEEKTREASRAERLHARKMLPIEDAEKAACARKMAEARVLALEAAVDFQEASVAETEANIKYMFIIAPFDGTVVDKQGEVGEIINPMSMSSTSGRAAVVTLASLDKMDVETDVAEGMVSRVAIGQPAEISVSAVPSHHYRGRLRQVIPMGDRARGTVKVKVEILDPDGGLFPELVATVHFLPDKAVANPDAGKSYLFVPKTALFDENGHTYAWVVDGKSRVSKRSVEVALTNDELGRVESGLKSGESVVLNPPRTLREHEVVKVAD
jgi:RND family efflux transporter MFP subunit